MTLSVKFWPRYGLSSPTGISSIPSTAAEVRKVNRKGTGATVSRVQKEVGLKKSYPQMAAGLETKVRE